MTTFSINFEPSIQPIWMNTKGDLCLRGHLLPAMHKVIFNTVKLKMVAFLSLDEWKKRKAFFSSADMSVEVWDQANGQNHVLQVENQFF